MLGGQILMKIINENDVVFGYLSYGNISGGKKRPILIIKERDESFKVYKITSQFDNKSDYIKQAYYPIKNLDSAGLRKKSYVDLGQSRLVSKSKLNNSHIIGKLSLEDIRDMKQFKSTIKERRFELRNNKNIQRELKDYSQKNPEIIPNNKQDKNINIHR